MLLSFPIVQHGHVIYIIGKLSIWVMGQNHCKHFVFIKVNQSWSKLIRDWSMLITHWRCWSKLFNLDQCCSILIQWCIWRACNKRILINWCTSINRGVRMLAFARHPVGWWLSDNCQGSKVTGHACSAILVGSDKLRRRVNMFEK